MSIIVINYYKMQSGRNTVLTGFSSDLRFASQSPPANFKAAKRRSVFRLHPCLFPIKTILALIIKEDHKLAYFSLSANHISRSQNERVNTGKQWVSCRLSFLPFRPNPSPPPPESRYAGYCKREKCSMFVTRVVSSMSIHCQNNTHVLQGKPIRRRPAVVFRATEMRFPARATSRLALASSLR